MIDYYRELIEQIIKMPVLQYEETYTAFSRILLAKIRGEEIVLIYNDSKKLCAVKRYLASVGVECGKEVFVGDNPSNLLCELNTAVNSTQSDVQCQYLFVSTIRFDQCWWMSRIPREIRFYTHWRKYKECRNLVGQTIYFSPIFLRERGQEIYEYLTENVDAFAALFENLADNLSKETLKEILEVAVTNRVWSLSQGSQIAKYWECYKHLDDECWVNCGSATGDTIIKYLYSGYKFERIYAYEGEPEVFSNLESLVSAIPKEMTDRMILINEYLGVESNADNFDNKFKDKKVTFINMDIEGAEMAVLRGARKLIKKQRPVLAICAYHKASDLIEIPKFIAETADDYLFYLRKYIGYEPGALNEYLYYCVPIERS